MKSRLKIVLAAIFLAAVATAGVALYIGRLQAAVNDGQKLVGVLVASRPIAAGTSVTEMQASGTLGTQQMPKRYIAEGALTSLSGYGDRVLAVDLAKGEQVTTADFKKANESGLAYKVPKNSIAVSIPVDEQTGVAGKLQPGDHVDLLGTFSPGPGGKDMTKIMLQNIEILATPSAETASSQNSFTKGQTTTTSGKKTITLAVSHAQAEKLVFAAEKGHIWLGLRQSDNNSVAPTSGQTVESVFN